MLPAVRQLEECAAQTAKAMAESAAKITDLDLLVMNKGWRAEYHQQSPGATRRYYWHIADCTTSQWDAPAGFVEAPAGFVEAHGAQSHALFKVADRLPVGLSRLECKINGMLRESKVLADRNKVLEEEKAKSAAAAAQRAQQAVEKEQALVARVRELEQSIAQEQERSQKQAGMIETQRHQLVTADVRANVMRALQTQLTQRVATIEQLAAAASADRDREREAAQSLAAAAAADHESQLSGYKRKLDDVELLVLNKGWKAYRTKDGRNQKYYHSITGKFSQWEAPPAFVEVAPAAAGAGNPSLPETVNEGISRLQSKAEEMLSYQARLEEELKGASDAAEKAALTRQDFAAEMDLAKAWASESAVSVKQLTQILLQRAETEAAAGSCEAVADDTASRAACSNPKAAQTISGAHTLSCVLGNVGAALEEHRVSLEKVMKEHVSAEDAMAERIAALEDDLSLALELLDEEEPLAQPGRSKYVALCNPLQELISTWIARAGNSEDSRCGIGGIVMARRALDADDGDDTGGASSRESELVPSLPILRPIALENLRKV